jgi:hypothetical protein
LWWLWWPRHQPGQLTYREMCYKFGGQSAVLLVAFLLVLTRHLNIAVTVVASVLLGMGLLVQLIMLGGAIRADRQDAPPIQ